MLSFEEGLAAVLALASECRIGERESLPLDTALGCILAEDIHAPIDVPPQDNSAMDGYAVSVADVRASKRLPVSQRIAAGVSPAPLLAGTTARIFTGAPIPVGADAVVMQENTCAHEHDIEFLEAVEVGDHIRPAGQDLRKGSLALSAGTRLEGRHLGLAASLGIAELPCIRPLRIALFSTGDELRAPGTALDAGQIYDSNRIMLQGLCQPLGCEIHISEWLPDQPEQIRASFTKAAAECDLILSSGGVSVGEEDHVKAVIAELGTLDMWKIAIKPGKPLALGRIEQCRFIGLPGNPVSSFVTFQLFVRPYIERAQGAASTALNWVTVQAGFSTRQAGTRDEFLRVQLNNGVATVHPNQSSGVLSSVTWADALARIPAGTVVAEGDDIPILSL